MSPPMGMRMGAGQHQGQRQSQSQTMRASPSLIAFTEMLQMGGQALQALILREITENPALELVDGVPAEPVADELLARETLRAAERDTYEAEDESYDVFRTVADQRTLAEHLLVELDTAVDDADLEVAEFMIGELDERGFLRTSLATIAATCGVSKERVAHVLRALQSVGPLGVGARDVGECLALQLARWGELGVRSPVAEAIVAQHLEDLAHGRYRHIADALGVPHEAVIEAREFIRSHLRPYPIAERTDLAPWERQTGIGATAPDIIVRFDGEGALAIEVTGSRRLALRISEAYRRVAERLAAGGGAAAAPGAPPLSEAERALVEEQVERAARFMAHIEERRGTMLRVARYVMGRQRGFLEHGPRHLVPLTRAQVAEALDLHESTISRATADKYVMLPNRQVVPYALFFKASLSVQDVLKELVETEARPLTDSELVGLLAARGYRLARRTVAKYRGELGILPSSKR